MGSFRLLAAISLAWLGVVILFSIFVFVRCFLLVGCCFLLLLFLFFLIYLFPRLVECFFLYFFSNNACLWFIQFFFKIISNGLNLLLHMSFLVLCRMLPYFLHLFSIILLLLKHSHIQCCFDRYFGE